jgi:hypothetical protein
MTEKVQKKSLQSPEPIEGFNLEPGFLMILFLSLKNVEVFFSLKITFLSIKSHNLSRTLRKKK